MNIVVILGYVALVWLVSALLGLILGTLRSRVLPDDWGVVWAMLMLGPFGVILLADRAATRRFNNTRTQRPEIVRDIHMDPTENTRQAMVAETHTPKIDWKKEGF
jgi:hypothetical protein